MNQPRFHRLAKAELQEATLHYAGESSALGGRFLLEISEALGFLLRFPKGAQSVSGEIRCFPLNRFPFSIVYRPLLDGGLRILAIAHQSRKPGYWSRRQ